MSYDKHVHVGDRYIVRKTGPHEGAILHVCAYACAGIFDWLPDLAIFETDLVLVLRKEGKPFPAIYHSGTTYYEIKTLAHIAGLAAACYSVARGGKAPSPLQVRSYSEGFIQAYKEIKDFPTQGYYSGKDCIWSGKILQPHLLTETQFNKWLKDNKFEYPAN